MKRGEWRTLPREKVLSQKPNGRRNSPIFRSRKGPLGKIVVYRFTGVGKNIASRTISQFEKNLGGDRDYVATLLEANPSLSHAESVLIKLLRDPTRKNYSLARLIAESKAEPAKVISRASQGALLLGQAEAYIEIGMSMPQVVRELRRHITPKEEMCPTCEGKGKVPRSVKEAKETIICPSCKGEGGILTTSPSMEFATEKLIDLSKMGSKGQGQVPVQVAIQNTMQGGNTPGLMERLMTTTSHIFEAPRDTKALPPPEPPIEAEIVEEEEEDLPS